MISATPRGHGAAPVEFLFIHGWLGSTADWDALRARLCAPGVAYAPGGLSIEPPPAGFEWTLDRGRAELDRHLAAAPGAIAVGSSASGSVALACAASRQMTGVVAIAAAPRWTTSPSFPFGFPPESTAAVAAMMRADFAGTVAQVMPAAYLDEADPELATRVSELVAARAASVKDSAHLIEALEQSWTADLVAALPSIRCPVLLIGGERDHIVTPELIRWTAARISDCEVAIIPGAGHLPHVTATDAVSAAISRFEARVRKVVA